MVIRWQNSEVFREGTKWIAVARRSLSISRQSKPPGASTPCNSPPAQSSGVAKVTSPTPVAFPDLLLLCAGRRILDGLRNFSELRTEVHATGMTTSAGHSCLADRGSVRGTRVFLNGKSYLHRRGYSKAEERFRLGACGKSRGSVTRDEFTRLDGANRPDSQPKGLEFVTLRALAKHLTAPESDALDQSDSCHRLLGKFETPFESLLKSTIFAVEASEPRVEAVSARPRLVSAVAKRRYRTSRLDRSYLPNPPMHWALPHQGLGAIV